MVSNHSCYILRFQISEQYKFEYVQHNDEEKDNNNSNNLLKSTPNFIKLNRNWKFFLPN